MLELSLIEFDLSNNHLTGHFPVEIGTGNLTGLRNLISMNLSYNNLSGEIPRSFDTLTSLMELYLGNNALQGAIPASLSSLRISRKIPNFLDELVSLKFLNLSYNDLEGEVPSKGVFRNMSVVSIVGNSKLCGGIPEFKMPKCSNKYSSENSSLDIIPRVIYNTLHKATNGFSTSNMIGSGTFSSVYRGILEENGNCVAIKVLIIYLCRSSPFPKHHSNEKYATGNTFSTYGDVYSYGSLLLETLTGRSPTDEIFKVGLNLHDFVKRAIPEQVKDVSDPKLIYDERGRLISTKKQLSASL
ncbi:hypothetical protein K7X08_002562 [Anisodus acutangulus]|uniref:Uncharacterized protein n=1 Tax=Anisodus acutangulus TaxID=402998 RepID=A0A9Q1R7E1_9SOLA|nr:hypothetical protein K7X08_002562 [Anisodus acutangulus]